MKKAAPKKAKKPVSSLKIPIVCGAKSGSITSFHNEQTHPVATGLSIALPADHAAAGLFREKGKYILTITRVEK